jgi:phospholipase C
MRRATFLVLGGTLLGCGSSSSQSQTNDTTPDTGVDRTMDMSQGGAAGAASEGESGAAGNVSAGGADMGGAGGGDTGDALGDASVASADSGAMGCNSPQIADNKEAMRTACSFKPKSMVADTIGVDPTTIRKLVKHVIILMQENHSFDNMFGHTGHGMDGTPATFTNPDAMGKPVAPHHLATPCPCDPPHQTPDGIAEWDNDKMDGFLTTAGDIGMGYYEDADHPFYTWLVTTFATSDRYFHALMGPTWQNRRYFYQAQIPDAQASIFDELTAKKVDWMTYYDGGNYLGGAYGTNPFPNNTKPLAALDQALADGTLPTVVFVNPRNDEHPSNNISESEVYVHGLVDHIFKSPTWSSTVFLFTYDEWGGFADHVPPPKACTYNGAAAATVDVDHYGFRVPVYAVSPFSRPGYVSHSIHSHTSILRFIQLVFDLPAISYRDANADAMLDMFDFACAPFAKAPTDAPVPVARKCNATCEK